MIKIRAIFDDGEVFEYYSWRTTPRNLMKAIEVFPQYKKKGKEYCENGIITSWLEIDHVTMTEENLSAYRYDTDPLNYFEDLPEKAPTKTEWCKNFICSVHKTTGEIT